MDQLSFKVLKLISKHQKPTHESCMYDKFGLSVESTLKYLVEKQYIEELLDTTGMRPDYESGMLVPRETPSGYYRILPRGKEYLQFKPGNDFDRWITRICAIIGAISGILALVMEFILHFSN